MSKRLSLTFILFLLVFSSITIGAASTTGDNLINGGFWSPPEDAGDFSFLDFERGADGIIHLIGYSTSCCPYDVLYTQRDFAGNWSSPETVASDVETSFSEEGELAVSTDGTAYVIWIDTEGGGDKVKYARRITAGNWSEPVTISGAAHNADGISLLINNSNQLYASWFSRGEVGLYSRHQVGGNWSNIQRVDNNQAPFEPVMLIDNQQNIHYFWFYVYIPNPQEAGIFYRKQSADNSWGPVIPISGPPAAPGIAARLFATLDSQNGQDLYATWGFQEGSNQNIYFAEFTNGSWKNPVKLNTTNASFFPIFIGASGNNVYIINGDNDSQSYTFRFRPFGGSWTSEPMAFLGTFAEVIGHVSHDNTLHLVWDTSATQVQYRTRQNLGPWSAIENVGGSIVYGEMEIKQQGIHLDMGWVGGGNTSKYSHGLRQTTNLPPQQYIPGLFK